MDDSWRFRPIQGNICPTCSISHFPFCYQPPPFNQFPSNPPLNRPVFDPLWDNRGIPRPLSHFDKHGFGMPEPLNRNQSFDNRGLQPNPNFGYGGNGLVPGEFDESDRIHKRMRVGEMSSSPGSGSFVQMPPPFGGYNHGRISSEDERRLSLIRNHGAPSSAMQSHVGMNGYMHESSRSDWQPRFPANAKTTSFPDYRFGSADRMGPMQSMVYEEKKELQRGGHDLGFGHQPQMPRNMQSDVDAAVIGNREESGKVLFESQKEQSQHPGYGASNYVSPAQHIMDSSVVRQENDHQWGDHPFFPPQKDGHNQHSHVGHQQLLPDNFGQANELQHPQGNNLTVSSNSRIPVGQKHNFHYHDLRNDTRPSFDVKHQPMENINTPVGPHNLPIEEQFGLSRMNQPGAYLHVSTSNNVVPARQSQMMSSQPLVIHPPLPPLPPHPCQFDPPVASPLHLQARSSSPNVSSVYPGPTASSVIMPLNSLPLEGQPFMPKHPSPDKPKVVDASCLFLPPDRATRPDHIVIILRGFPGSGKSYLAKLLRDLEVENGGSAPRIHSMDDYFMTEVEKVEEVDNSKSSSMVKGKKRTTKKVMEYCYEPEMEEAYRSSMLKAFKKTLEEGNFTFVIVDDRNLRVADFAQFWASAKRSGYEVYLLEASYKDPVGCAARNVHAFTSDDVHKMAALWEEAPSLYLQLNVQSLFRGDNLKESEIQEVDMDMEDASSGEGSSELSNSNSLKVKEPPAEDCASEGSFKDERWDAEGDDPTRVKELGRSKWSHDEGEEDDERIEGVRGNSNALSGLIQAYSKGEKVHWGDQVGKTGFSIGAAKKAMSLSLIIGPGAGYNLKANPLPEEENVSASEHGRQSRKRSIFEEQLRAERESFRAVFDRRRHRIGGLDTEEE